jgi:hypothetical protein
MGKRLRLATMDFTSACTTIRWCLLTARPERAGSIPPTKKIEIPVTFARLAANNR